MTNQVRAYREKAGLSRSRFVRLLPFHMDQNTLYMIENGTTPSATRAVALAQALSEALGEPVSVEDLFRPETVTSGDPVASKPPQRRKSPAAAKMRGRKARIEFVGRISTTKPAAA